MSKQVSRTRAEWRELIAALDASGASVREFAAAHGLVARTVAWWRSCFRREPADAVPVAFVSIEVADGPSPEFGRIEARLPSGVVLTFERTFDVETLRTLASALMSTR